MTWVLDTYSQLKGKPCPGVVTGKTAGTWRFQGKTIGNRTWSCDQHQAPSCRRWQGVREGTKVAIQGCGNVGGNTARIFGHRGAVVVAISDVSGGIYKETGLDVDKVTAYVEAGGLLADYQEDGVTHISNTDILTCDCDVLVPAALENQITKEVAEKLKCSYIVEGANGPTAADADPILAERGIKLVPDIFCKQRRCYCFLFFEWVQNIQEMTWEKTAGK